MKNLNKILGLAGAGFLTIMTGCSKQEPASTPPAAATQEPVNPPVATETVKPVEPPKPVAPEPPAAAKEVAADVQNKADASAKAATDAQAQATAAITSKSQAVIDNVKSLLADNKPADALKALQTLDTSKLTPDQQSVVETLKKQAQALVDATSKLGGKAADAVNGLLPKK